MSDGQISGDSDLSKIFTRLSNVWYRRADTIIWSAVNGWQFDDSDHTDLPRAKATLVDDQHDYEIPSAARQIFEVHIKNDNGDYVSLKAIDKDQYDQPLDEVYDTKGTPTHYDLEGRSVFLYPAPDSSDVTTSEVLRLYMGRDIDEFVSSDTTKEPGFDNHFHEIIPVGASLDYALGYLSGDPRRINELKGRLQEIRTEMTEFYAGRDKDFKTKLRRQTNRQNFV